MVDWLDQTDIRLVPSYLLETELRRVAVREGRDQAKVSAILTYDYRLGEAATASHDVIAPGTVPSP